MPSSSNSFDSTVDVALRPSTRALQGGVVLHGVLAVLLMASGATPWALMAGAFGLAVSWAWLRRHPAFGHGPRAITRLVWHGDGRWTLHTAGGVMLDAELLPDSIVLARLWVLRFRAVSGARHARIVLGDEAPPEQLRRIRARLTVA